MVGIGSELCLHINLTVLISSWSPVRTLAITTLKFLMLSAFVQIFFVINCVSSSSLVKLNQRTVRFHNFNVNAKMVWSLCNIGIRKNVVGNTSRVVLLSILDRLSFSLEAVQCLLFDFYGSLDTASVFWCYFPDSKSVCIGLLYHSQQAITFRFFSAHIDLIFYTPRKLHIFSGYDIAKLPVE